MRHTPRIRHVVEFDEDETETLKEALWDESVVVAMAEESGRHDDSFGDLVMLARQIDALRSKVVSAERVELEVRELEHLRDALRGVAQRSGVEGADGLADDVAETRRMAIDSMAGLEYGEA